MKLSTLAASVVAAIEVRETYETRQASLRRRGAHLTARRLKRASLAELLNPPTPGYGDSRER